MDSANKEKEVATEETNKREKSSPYIIDTSQSLESKTKAEETIKQTNDIVDIIPQTEILPKEDSSSKSIEIQLEIITQMENESPVFITNPELKEGIKRYMNYNVYGKNISIPLSRKYSDFSYLREKLVERWPGVFIPNIPENQSDSNTDSKTVEINIRLLNRFCTKLFSIPFISQSTEMQLFFSNIDNVIEEMDNLPQLSFKDIIDKYKIAIPLNDNTHLYDITKSKEQLEEHSFFVNELMNNIKNIKDYAKETMENKTKEINNYICLLNVFKDYEKHALIEYADNDESKLIFSNQHNKELKEKYHLVISSLRNPYASLNEWIEEDEYDLKAMIEVYESIKHFESEHNKLNNRVKEIENDIIKQKSGEGKSGFSSLLSFKSPDDIISRLQNEQEANQIGMYYLDMIIAMVSQYSILNFESFKLSKLSDYYKHLKQFNDIQMMNSKYIGDFWKCVQKDNNVKLKESDNIKV